MEMSAKNMARMMCGHVRGYTDSYIEDYIPEHILSKLDECPMWADTENYIWGYNNVFADLHPVSKVPYVCLAQIAMGQGNYSLKVIYPPSQNVEILNING